MRIKNDFKNLFIDLIFTKYKILNGLKKLYNGKKFDISCRQVNRSLKNIKTK